MNTPITVHVHFSAKPGKSLELQSFLSSALVDVRQVPGCSGARILADAEHEGELMLVEQWASVTRHEEHVAALVDGGLMAQLLSLTTSAPRSEYFSVTGPGTH